MLQKISIFAILFILMIQISNANARTKIGLWIECEGTEDTLSSPAKINKLIEDARDMGVNVLFVQAHRGNKSWFDSSYADKTPYNKFLKQYGTDPMNYIIARAKDNGMEVHMWLNTFRILKNKNTRIVQTLGTKILTRDANKKSILQYPVSQLPDGAYWIDPGDLDARGYLLSLVREAMQKYPQIDGIHLDFIRNPYGSGPGFGYGVESVKRFQAKYGINPFRKNLSRAEQQLWDDWRRDQVTALVKAAYPVCKAENKELSVAVMCWADRAYLTAFQDWRGWLEDGIVDFVATMNYTIDNKFAKYLSREAICAKGNRKVMVGLGPYLLNSRITDLGKQIRDAIALGADGIVLFSYDSMVDSGKLPKFKQVIRNSTR